MFDNKEFINFFNKSKEKKKDIVLINVLDTEGSAYRKSGATMMVNSNSEFIGVVSAGTFEEDIIHATKEVLEDRKGKYIVHDLKVKNESNESWENSTGCNGLIKLWMEPFYFEDNYGSLGIALENAIKGIGNTLIRSIKNSGAHSFSPTFDKRICFYNENEKLFYQRIIAPYKLLILGASPAADALIKIANILGWQTVICDSRQTSLSYIQSADEKIFLKSYEQSSEIVDNNKFDAAVVMSHNFTSDAIYLKSLIQSKVSYIGVMGPKKRTKLMIESLYKKSSPIDPRIHNPVGLDLGGESPQSIALAICAEIEAFKNNSDAVPLKDKEGFCIHAR